MTRRSLIESSPRPISEEAEQRIYAALFANNKILAIKEHRQATGAGLAESKEFVEVLERELRQESPERFSPRNSLGCMSVAVLAIGGLLAAVI